MTELSRIKYLISEKVILHIVLCYNVIILIKSSVNKNKNNN